MDAKPRPDLSEFSFVKSIDNQAKNFRNLILSHTCSVHFFMTSQIIIVATLSLKNVSIYTTILVFTMQTRFL